MCRRFVGGGVGGRGCRRGRSCFLSGNFHRFSRPALAPATERTKFKIYALSLYLYKSHRSRPGRLNVNIAKEIQANLTFKRYILNAQYRKYFMVGLLTGSPHELSP